MVEKIPDVKQLFDLTGRVALVTGGAMGIGRQIAQGFLEVGAQVILTSRLLVRAREAAEELAAETGGNVLPIALNVRDEESVAAAFGQIADLFGHLDVLVNNAGGAPDSAHCAIWNRELKDWNEVIETNLTGTFLCTRAAARMMMPKRQGSIINVASIAGMVGRDRRMYEGLRMRPNLADYAASKAGILGFTRDVAAELGPFGIRVNAISPGGVQRNHDPEFVRRYADATALGRMSTEGLDMKGMAVLLASDAGAYITGANMIVDGGFLCFK
ncbi:MAG: SDR family oxidoreductase [Candidatus Latescibacterota bacterium]